MQNDGRTKKSDWPTLPIKLDPETRANGEMVARALGCFHGDRPSLTGACRLLLGMTEEQARAVAVILHDDQAETVDGIRTSRSVDGLWTARVMEGPDEGYYAHGSTADEAL